MARSLAAVLCPWLPPREGPTARRVAISAVFTGDTVLGLLDGVTEPLFAPSITPTREGWLVLDMAADRRMRLARRSSGSAADAAALRAALLGDGRH
jgi:hypothetical protein